MSSLDEDTFFGVKVKASVIDELTDDYWDRLLPILRVGLVSVGNVYVHSKLFLKNVTPKKPLVCGLHIRKLFITKESFAQLADLVIKEELDAQRKQNRRTYVPSPTDITWFMEIESRLQLYERLAFHRAPWLDRVRSHRAKIAV